MAIEKNLTGATASNKPDETGQPANAPKTSSAAQNNDDSSLKQTLKDTAGNAAGQVKDKAATAIDEQKSKVAVGLSSVADELRRVGGNLRESSGGDDKNYLAQGAARYGDTLADKVENLSGYLENASLKDLARDLEVFARQQPAIFVGGALIAGILAARFLKSSAPQSGSQSFSGTTSADNKSGNDFADSGNVLEGV